MIPFFDSDREKHKTFYVNYKLYEELVIVECATADFKYWYWLAAQTLCVYSCVNSLILSVEDDRSRFSGRIFIIPACTNLQFKFKRWIKWVFSLLGFLRFWSENSRFKKEKLIAFHCAHADMVHFKMHDFNMPNKSLTLFMSMATNKRKAVSLVTPRVRMCSQRGMKRGTGWILHSFFGAGTILCTRICGIRQCRKKKSEKKIGCVFHRHFRSFHVCLQTWHTLALTLTLRIFIIMSVHGKVVVADRESERERACTTALPSALLHYINAKMSWHLAQCVHNTVVSMWQHGLLCCILKCPKMKMWSRCISGGDGGSASHSDNNKQISKCIRKCIARCKVVCKLILYPFH